MPKSQCITLTCATYKHVLEKSKFSQVLNYTLTSSTASQRFHSLSQILQPLSQVLPPLRSSTAETFSDTRSVMAHCEFKSGPCLVSLRSSREDPPASCAWSRVLLGVLSISIKNITKRVLYQNTSYDNISGHNRFE